MKAQAITFCVLVLGTVALCTPRQDTAAEAAGTFAAPAAAKDTGPEVPRANEEPGWQSGGKTTLTRDEDGHFYAEVRVDGRRVDMLVDTGASFIALTREDADAAGVDWREDDAIVVGKGASGPVRGVPVTIDEVELGDYRARDVQAAVIVDGLEVSLLGQSFLGQIDAMTIEGDRMILGD